MGHTNSTANLALPQFIGTDKPTWLGDINSAFSDIDAYVGTNDAAVAGAVADAGSAVSQAASAVSTANAANTTAGNASTAATNAVGTANNAMALVNQTNTKIGTLANLNTTDKTSIVNAINEVYGIATSADSVTVTADGVKTNATLLGELFTAVDPTKLTAKSKLVNDRLGGTIYYASMATVTSNSYVFALASVNPSDGAASVVYTLASTGKYEYGHGTSYSDWSSQVPSAGTTYVVIY